MKSTDRRVAELNRAGLDRVIQLAGAGNSIFALTHSGRIFQYDKFGEIGDDIHIDQWFELTCPLKSHMVMSEHYTRVENNE